MKYRIAKRIIDLVLAILLLPIALVLSIPIIIWIKADSKGDAIICQRRVGKMGREFTCYKFRTMKTNAPTVARRDLENAQMYITRAGRLLRKYGLDELPQIINVLKGDMSFVGPRPLLACEEPVHRMRLECGLYTIAPGITGLCQLRCRDVKSAAKRVAIDYEYFCQKSLWLDFCIIFYTVFPSRNGIWNESDLLIGVWSTKNQNLLPKS